jgi:hypothetical protein
MPCLKYAPITPVKLLAPRRSMRQHQVPGIGETTAWLQRLLRRFDAATQYVCGTA